MESEPRSSWLALKLGWKLLNVPKKNNILFSPRKKIPLLFLTLKPPILLHLPLLSRSRN
jgi:hypothetical protein